MVRDMKPESGALTVSKGVGKLDLTWSLSSPTSAHLRNIPLIHIRNLILSLCATWRGQARPEVYVLTERLKFGRGTENRAVSCSLWGGRHNICQGVGGSMPTLINCTDNMNRCETIKSQKHRFNSILVVMAFVIEAVHVCCTYSKKVHSWQNKYKLKCFCLYLNIFIYLFWDLTNPFFLILHNTWPKCK